MENSTKVLIGIATAGVIGAGVALVLHESDSPMEHRRREVTHRIANSVNKAADATIDTIRSAAGRISDSLN